MCAVVQRNGRHAAAQAAGPNAVLLTLYRQRFAEVLRALRDEWDAGRRHRHAQCTGMVLGHLGSRIGRAPQYLDMTLDYVATREVYGVDGVLLSLMSACQVIDPDRFGRAVGLCDTMAGSVTLPTKDGLGIYFLDFGVGLPSVNGGIGGLSRDPRAASLISSFTSLLSGFPDSTRDGLFNGGLQPWGAGAGMGFGNTVRGIGSDEVQALPPDDRMDLYSETEEGCKTATKWAGAIIAAGLAIETGPIGMFEAAHLGAFGGEIMGELFCGVKIGPASGGREPAGGGASGPAAGGQSGPATGGGASGPSGAAASGPSGASGAAGSGPSGAAASGPSGASGAGGSGPSGGGASGAGGNGASGAGGSGASGSSGAVGGDGDENDDDPNAVGATTGGEVQTFVDPDAAPLGDGAGGLPGAAVFRALGIMLSPPADPALGPRDRIGRPAGDGLLGGGNHLVVLSPAPDSPPGSVGHPDVTTDRIDGALVQGAAGGPYQRATDLLDPHRPPWF